MPTKNSIAVCALVVGVLMSGCAAVYYTVRSIWERSHAEVTSYFLPANHLTEREVVQQFGPPIATASGVNLPPAKYALPAYAPPPYPLNGKCLIYIRREFAVYLYFKRGRVNRTFLAAT